MFTRTNPETTGAIPTTGILNDILISEPDLLDTLKSNKVSGIDKVLRTVHCFYFILFATYLLQQ